MMNLLFYLFVGFALVGGVFLLGLLIWRPIKYIPVKRPGTMVNIPLPDRRWRLYPPTGLSVEAIEDFLKYWDHPENFKRVTKKLRKIFQGQESDSGSDQK